MGTTTAMLATSSTPGARPQLRVLPGGLPPARVPAGSRPSRAAGPAAGPAAGRSAVRADPRRRSHLGAVARIPQPGRRERIVPRDQPGGPAAKVRVGGVAAAQPVPMRLRLTRRGRLVVRWAAVLLAAVVACVLTLVLSRPASAGSQSRPVPVRYHVVLPGETLWGLAGGLAPHADRRDVIAEIIELNALPGAGVSVGQRIALPPVS